MYFTISAQHAFDASHTLENHDGCGHRWTITVVARQHYDVAKKRLPDQPDLQNALEELLRPLYNRSLNDMLLGVSASPEGMATWASEQLSLSFPDLTEVTVAASYGKTVTLHREIRRPGGLL